MNILVLDSRPEVRERLIEVLSWFGGIQAVHEAGSAREVEALGSDARIDAVIVGDLPHFSPEAGVRFARMLFDSARILAASAFEFGSAIHDRLLAAGAECVIDLRMSIWKNGVVLRAALCSGAEIPAPTSAVPGLRVQLA